jgi:hypothetical protein
MMPTSVPAPMTHPNMRIRRLVPSRLGLNRDVFSIVFSPELGRLNDFGHERMTFRLAKRMALGGSGM